MYSPPEPIITTLARHRRLQPTRDVCRLVTFLFVLTLGLQIGQAQEATPSPTPTAEELRLQEEKKLILLMKDFEEAKKALRVEQQQPKEPPAPTATPLAGEATLDEGVRLETELVSYNAVSRAATAIAAEIGSKVSDAKNIAIYDAQIVKDWRFYQALFPAFEGQVRDLKNQYKTLLGKEKLIPLNVAPREFMAPETVASALSAGTTLLKSVVDLAALFRTDTKIEGRAVTVNQNALIAELLRELKKKDSLSLYYPGVFPPQRPHCPETVKDSNGDDMLIDKCAEGSTVLIDIGDLFSYKARAEEMIEQKRRNEAPLLEQVKPATEKLNKLDDELSKVLQLNARLVNLNDAATIEKDPEVLKRLQLAIARLKVQISELRTKPELEALIKETKESIADTADAIDTLEKKIKELSDVNARFEKFVDDFVKVDSNGVNALALLVKSQNIENALKEQQSYWIEMQSVTAGGNNRVRKNLFRYFSGPKIDHSGGVVIEYVLYDKSGAVIFSDKISCYEGYVEPKNIGNLTVDLKTKPCLKF